MDSKKFSRTLWLNNFPVDMQHYMAKVYIETMTEDIEELKRHLHTRKQSIAIIHKIKGGLAQIGLESILRSVLLAEQLGRSDSHLYQKSLEELIATLELSLIDVNHWVIRHTHNNLAPTERSR